jgi:hypothetical protein
MGQKTVTEKTDEGRHTKFLDLKPFFTEDCIYMDNKTTDDARGSWENYLRPSSTEVVKPINSSRIADSESNTEPLMMMMDRA